MSSASSRSPNSASARRYLAQLPPAERAADPLSEDLFGDVFLVVDGWATIRDEFDALEPSFQFAGRPGPILRYPSDARGGRWAEIRPVVRDLIGTRLELRLGDPSDSEMDRRTAVTRPGGAAGTRI